MTLFEQVRDAIASTLDVPATTIHENTSANDIPAWDSLGQVNIMMTIEQTFDLMLDVEDIAELNSVPLIMEYLGQQGVDSASVT